MKTTLEMIKKACFIDPKTVMSDCPEMMRKHNPEYVNEHWDIAPSDFIDLEESDAAYARAQYDPATEARENPESMADCNPNYMWEFYSDFMNKHVTETD